MTTIHPPLALTSHAFVSEGERASFRSDRLEDVASFLHAHLGRYGDSLDHIRLALHRAAGDEPHEGGSVTLAESGGEIVGAVVTNRTHMRGYTPEHLLVYVATHQDHRGRGIGKALMEEAAGSVEGSIALHVEPDNPAVGLYRKLGFTQKYLEMRLER